MNLQNEKLVLEIDKISVNDESKTSVNNKNPNIKCFKDKCFKVKCFKDNSVIKSPNTKKQQEVCELDALKVCAVQSISICSHYKGGLICRP